MIKLVYSSLLYGIYATLGLYLFCFACEFRYFDHYFYCSGSYRYDRINSNDSVGYLVYDLKSMSAVKNNNNIGFLLSLRSQAKDLSNGNVSSLKTFVY